MSTFSENVRALCKQKGITVAGLERAVNIANGSIHTCEIRNTKPKRENLEKIASYLDVTPEYLIGEENRKNAVLLIKSMMAENLTAVENVIGQIEVSDGLAATGPLYAMKIKEDAMSPMICEGDTVIVRQQEKAENGDTVVAIVDGLGGVCRIYRATNNAIMLIAHNAAYAPLVYTQEEPIKIIGKVVELRRTLK